VLKGIVHQQLTILPEFSHIVSKLYDFLSIFFSKYIASVSSGTHWHTLKTLNTVKLKFMSELCVGHLLYTLLYTAS